MSLYKEYYYMINIHFPWANNPQDESLMSS